MSTIESFDDFYSTENQANALEVKPFQFRDDPKDKKKTREWLVEQFDKMEKNAHSRFITYRRYQALYKGLHWRYYDARDVNRETNYSQRKPRMVMNFIKRNVDMKVAQMARLKSNITLIPNNDEQDDINNAKACKMLIDARAEQIGLEQLHQLGDEIKYIFGHCFTFVEWDPECGPLHPAYIKAKKEKRKVPKLDEKGKPIKGKYVDGEIHIGDVKVEPLGPDRVFVELGKEKWEKVDYIYKVEWIHIDALKGEYPQHAEEIQENRRNLFDYETSELTRPIDMVMVRTFYHRKTKHLPEGAIIRHTDDVILEWKPLHYDHGKLPCVPDTDIDIYGEFWGRSFIYLIEQAQRMYNNIQSAVARDYNIGSAPKWMVPKGSCDIQNINNEFTIVEFTGPVAPKLVESKPTSNQAFEVQDRLEAKIGDLSAIHDISRGEVPTGVTANSALRFLDEQESQRIIVQERKRKKRVVDVARMMMDVMGQYYTATDGRTVRILGDNNEFLIKSMKKARFSEIYDVKLQNSPALPDTKTGKIAAIIDLNTATQTDPIFGKEEVVNMLDLGMDDAFKSKATVAVTAAKTTIDELLDGNAVPEPQIWEDLLVQYPIFVREMQSFSFKTKVKAEVVEAFSEHVKMMEALMYRKAQKNQMYAQKVAMMDDFPIFFNIPAPVPAAAPPAEGGVEAGEMNTTKEVIKEEMQQ